ncbi:peptidase-C39 like family protein [Catalinimonas alkaloidigena]|uniref:peptidase-C39 like family protein n=1 Tax=Catalinimonas alkaloidigena TaxID=1075417 RepID=UPI002405F897|nr:peptidase-C39 like family protein [Catalinimonas alkaloidigena]
MDDNKHVLTVNIKPQPDDVTCGPTCLHALYNYYQDHLDMEVVIGEVQQLKSGGTLAVYLGIHALQRGYQATIYTYNLHIFDPTWFTENTQLHVKLRQQASVKRQLRIKLATDAYVQFLSLGGKILYEELTPRLLKKYLVKQIPILTGLSATYLYQCAREIAETNQYHDIKGEPSGHFVLIKGYDRDSRMVHISDPLNPNPVAKTEQHYQVPIDRLINAILLGIVTYDANLLIIQPKKS